VLKLTRQRLLPFSYPTYVAYGAATVAMFVYVTDIEAIVKSIPVYRKYKGLPKEG
jgi:hypothetical protein